MAMAGRHIKFLELCCPIREINQDIIVKGHLLQLGKGTAIYGMGTMLQRFISLLLLPLFTAYLSPHEYGVLAMLAILTMVAQPVFSLGMSAAMGPSYFERNNETCKAETVWTVFSILLVSSAVLLSCAWIMPELILKLVLLPEDYALLASLTLTGTALSILSTPFAQRVQFEQQAKKFVMITLVTTLTTTGLSVLTVVFLGWGLRGMVVSQLIGNVIIFIIFIVLTIRETSFSINRDIRNEVLRLGITLIPSFAFLFILMNSNKYILQWLSGTNQVGLYSIGFSIGSVVGLVVGAISTAWYPFFMSFLEKQEEARILFGRVLSYYMIGIGLLCLIFFSMGKPVIMLMTQPEFHPAFIVVGFAALTQFFIGMFNLFLPAIYFAKRVAYVSFIQGVAAVCSLPIAYVFIYWFGLLGASISIAVSHFLMAFGMLYFNYWNRKTFFVTKYEWSRIMKFTMLAIVVISLSLLVEPESSFMTILYGLILAFLSAFFALLSLTSNEKNQVIKMVKQKFLPLKASAF